MIVDNLIIGYWIMLETIPTFETPRLILRGVQLSDAPSYQKHFAHYEVIKYLSARVPWPYADDGAEFFIKTMVLPEQGKTRWNWGIFLKTNPTELIGAVELFHPGIPENRGFWLAQQHWGKGIMTEAVAPVMDFAFNILKLKSLIFANALENIRSHRVKEKTGAKLIDIRAAQYADPNLTHAQYWELTKEDWQKFLRKRKRKPQDPCQSCFLHKDRCICAHTPKLKLATKISLIIHAKELKRTTNTGRLALNALTNSEMRIRGEDHTALDLSDLVSPSYRTFLFYPADNALELNEQLVSQSSLPIQLIVPDGNWRQASKVHYRHHELKDIPRVKISTPNTADLHIRAETTEAGMATLEAIAHALGIIEGEAVKKELMDFYQLKLEATLRGRGQLD
jgi:DTW domain-containing protein YfiP/RimJ/RimL family protein N-acetyltransferase